MERTIFAINAVRVCQKIKYVCPMYKRTVYKSHFLLRKPFRGFRFHGDLRKLMENQRVQHDHNECHLVDEHFQVFSVVFQSNLDSSPKDILHYFT